MIRVLLVEDSITQREILKRVLEAAGDFTVVAEARNGKEGLARVEEHAPDVVLMDIHMPDMNGIEATREIMRCCPVPIVIVSATLKKRDIDMGLEALQAGAVSVMAKPEGAALLNLQKIAPRLCEQIRTAARAHIRRLPQPVLESLPPPSAAQPQGEIEVIGLCASTGGPAVLLDILAGLPRPYPLPILLVQHLAHGFEEGFASWLGNRTGQPVGLAQDGQRLIPGVWLAPASFHLTLGSATRITLAAGLAADIHCPSGDRLFSSLAQHAGSRAAGVLLTGMGNDGAHGLLHLKQAGGTTIIQEESSCLIWGMPRAAQELSAAQQELPPARIAALLTGLAERARPG